MVQSNNSMEQHNSVIVPMKKESYFTKVDTLMQSPDQTQLIVNTNLRKQYLIDVNKGILASSGTVQQLTPDSTTRSQSQRRIHCCDTRRDVYGLATSKGLCFGSWDGLVQNEYTSQMLTDSAFYSVSWLGDYAVAGGDDGQLVEVDGGSGQVTKSYSGHSGSVNVVKARDTHTFVSAGFDGVCRVWDRRTGTVEQSFSPGGWCRARRPAHGTHITCMDVLEDWVVCGGGPNLSLWYLKEDSGIALLNIEESVPSVVRFVGETIVAGGNTSFIRHWNLSGNLKYKVQSKLDTVTDILINTEAREQPMLLAVGSPTQINVFLDSGYLSHTVPYVV